MLDRPIMSAARAAFRLLAAGRPPADPVPPARDLPSRPMRPGPMRPLHPPAALNDNPLAALATEVERDLRARGYLR